MNTSRRGPPRTPRRDPGGRPLLAVFAVLLIGLGLVGFVHSDFNEYGALILVPIGALFLILFAFHSRIGGTVGAGKFQVPIVPEHHPEPPPDQSTAAAELPPAPPAEPPKPAPPHRPSLGEVSDAARNPTTQRNRSPR